MRWMICSFFPRTSGFPRASAFLPREGESSACPAVWPAPLRFCTGVLMVGLLCGGMYFWRLGDWPWDVDELSSLEEMGLLDPTIRQPVLHPESIVVRLPRLVPVWYTFQKGVLQWVPVNEWGCRLLSALCAIGAVMVLYGWAWRWRGPRFAAALALLAGGSLLLLWLAQQNRFYTMALLWLVLAEAAIWARSKDWGWMVGAILFTLLAVLTHNVAIVLFVLQAGVVLAGWALGGVQLAVALRAGLAGLLAAGVYLVHVRPIAGHWTGAGLTWAPPWASFTAHVGMPTLALALLGSALALVGEKERRPMGVWAGLTLGVLLFVLLVPWLMPVWNPRYSLLWVLPVWVTGAWAVETVGAALVQWATSSAGQPSGGLLGRIRPLLPGLLLVGWYGCVALLLVPKWASHWIDGTRHDYRQAAQWVVQFLEAKGAPAALPTHTGQTNLAAGPPWTEPTFSAGNPSSIGGMSNILSAKRAASVGGKPGGSAPPSVVPILTNMELQMRYYLPQVLRSGCRYWTPGMPLPAGECVVVLGGNGWEGPLSLPDRTVRWLVLVGRRRFDELSHTVRIYWVGPRDPRLEAR